MSKLIELFKELPLPKPNTEFSAVPAGKNCQHKIGKDINGCPTLLIAIKKSNSTTLIPNINLKNIKVTHDLECRITHKNKTENGEFTIVTFTGSDTNLYNSFLRFCEVILDSLKDNANRESVAKILDRCVKLFKDISKPPIKSIHGLWAELFFITLCKDKIKMIKSWHINPEDKWDFNLGYIRYEIKSASNRKRQHFFSHEQLREIEGSNITIISIFAEEAGAGKSIDDLVNDLKKTLKKRTDLIEKLYTICYKTLGNSLDNSFKIKFDTVLAKSSIKAYNLEVIPKISNKDIPPQITEIKYKIDLEGIKPNLETIHDLFE